MLNRAAALLVILLTASAASAEAYVVENGVVAAGFTNGVRARVYTAEYLSARTVIEADHGVIEIDGGSVAVITDVGDPRITNKGDGSFHPMDVDLVLECIEAVDHPNLRIEIEVFILPYPRVEVLSSSAVANRIFLSPQVLELSREGTAYIVTHELGHVFQYRHLPVNDPAWQEYARLRGILGDERFTDSAPHAYRPREIFAEDFRVLFGGSAAFYGGRIENPELPSPTAVAGLEEFCVALTSRAVSAPVIASLQSYPNPFNPQTELRVALSPDFSYADGDVTVRVYDVRGALVRELFAGRADGPDLRIVWDGRDGEGRQVASSTYFGVVEAGGARMTTKLLMIK